MGVTVRALGGLVLGLGIIAAPAVAADPAVNTSPPTVTGVATYRQTLSATPGTWSPEGVAFTYQWLRDAEPVPGEIGTTYRTGLDDLGRHLAVTVVATDATGAQSVATSASTTPVARADFTMKELSLIHI